MQFPSEEKVVAVTVCYGQKQEWTSRKEAEEYFFQAMVGCDPASSEHSRYSRIYTQLKNGKYECTDSDEEEAKVETVTKGKVEIRWEDIPKEVQDSFTRACYRLMLDYLADKENRKEANEKFGLNLPED